MNVLNILKMTWKAYWVLWKPLTDMCLGIMIYK